jgi:hypothetical protein
MDRNAFVRGILDDDDVAPPTEEQAFLSPSARAQSMRAIEGEYDSLKPTAAAAAGPTSTSAAALSKEKWKHADADAMVTPAKADHERAVHDAQAMFRYALIFINFTFVVAAMLLIMAGIVARENSAVKLCTHCGDITLVSIVFGIILWLFAMFGFNWIRERNILLLLVYVAFLGVMSVVLLGIIIAAGVFDREARDATNNNFLQQWMFSRNETSDGGLSPLCLLQRTFNCSGFQYGCCANRTVCYNASTESFPPPWFGEVCPICPGQEDAPKICTAIVYETLRKNLGGFLVITCFSMMLVLTGILLAFLSRKVNQSME